MFTDRRIWVVAVLGAVIVSLCAYRLQVNRSYDYDASLKAATIYAPAPLFEGLDENNEMFRLSAYAGRHRIVVVFFDGTKGADQSAELAEISKHADDLSGRGDKVVAVSAAIPQENRAALKQLGEFPGPLISDVDGSIHARWGRSTVNNELLPGLFLIDRKGNVAFQGGAPRPYADLASLWKDLKP